MKDKLIELENQLVGYSEDSKLIGENLLLFPENFRQIHTFNYIKINPATFEVSQLCSFVVDLKKPNSLDDLMKNNTFKK